MTNRLVTGLLVLYGLKSRPPVSVHLLLDSTLMPTQRWANHTSIAEFRWRRLTLRCLAHVTQAAWRAVIDMWQETSHQIAQTECTHPPELRVRRANQWASMDVCDRKRGGRGAILNYSPTAMACAQRNAKIKEKAKKKDSVNISQRAALWSVGRKRKGQRLSKVHPRALCFSDCHGLIMRCRGWDPTGTQWALIKACQDEAVKVKDKNTNHTEDGDLATGSGGPCAGPHTSLETSTLPGQDSGSQNPTLSNDWTAQMQVLMSNPELAQEQFAQWQLFHQQFQHLQYQQQLAASSNLESWQKFHHPGEDDNSIGGQWNLDTRMD